MAAPLGLDQHIPGHVHGAVAAVAGAQEDGDQFRIRQAVRSVVQQFEAGLFGLRPVANCHGEPPCSVIRVRCQASIQENNYIDNLNKFRERLSLTRSRRGQVTGQETHSRQARPRTQKYALIPDMG